MYPLKLYILFSIGLFTINSKAQWIEEFRLTLDFELYNNMNNLSNSPYFDYNNYINEYDEVYFDDANINIYANFWHKNNWQSSIQLGLQSDLIPREFEITATKMINPIGINMGIGQEVFFLYEMEKYFLQLDKSYYVIPNYLQDYLFLTGPIIGINYVLNSNRIKLTTDINIGLQWNNKIDMLVTLKEENSNYLLQTNYQSERTAALSLSPSIKGYFSIIKRNTFETGIFLRYKYYYTYRKFNYTQTTIEWTHESPTIYSPTLQGHHIQRHGFHVGVFFMFK